MTQKKIEFETATFIVAQNDILFKDSEKIQSDISSMDRFGFVIDHTPLNTVTPETWSATGLYLEWQIDFITLEFKHFYCRPSTEFKVEREFTDILFAFESKKRKNRD